MGVTLGDFGLTPSPDAAPVAAAERGNAAAAGTGEATVGLDADAFEAAVATLQVVAALQNIIFSLKKLFGMGGFRGLGVSSGKKSNFKPKKKPFLGRLQSFEKW